MRNSFSIHGDTVEIVLSSKRHGEQVAIIDAVDLSNVKRAERWSIVERDGKPYASGRIRVERARAEPTTLEELGRHVPSVYSWESVELQLAVGAPPRGFVLQFANGNTLDCRRDNLRIVLASVTKATGDRKSNPWRRFAWMSRADNILRVLRQLDCDILSSGDVMAIFEVQLVAALRAIAALGGYSHAGRRWITRAALINALERIKDGGDFIREQSRMRRVGAEIAAAAKHLQLKEKTIHVTREQLVAVQSSLPQGVELQRGRLSFEFDTADELFERLTFFCAWISDPSNDDELRACVPQSSAEAHTLGAH